MNARETIQLVVEGKAPNGWATTHGVFADLSNWPREIQYYVKCPKCGLVHGDFKSLKDANAQKLCNNCNVKAVNDVKDEIQKVIHDPEHKPKAMNKLIGEGIEPAPPEGEPEVPLPPEDDFDDDVPQDVMGEINRLIASNWIDTSLRQIADDENIDIEACIIDADWREGDYDRDAPDDTNRFKLDAGDHEYLVFKDNSEAEKYGAEVVREQLENEPELFTQDWLKHYIDEEKLRAALGDPYEEWESDVRNMYYSDLLDKMVEEGYVESDDTVFFKNNGDPRKEDRLRAAALNVYMEDYIAKEKPKWEPWDYLDQMYSKEEAIKWAIEWAGFDIDKATQGALDTDGWQHYVARYDHNSYDLDNGAVYCRIN